MRKSHLLFTLLTLCFFGISSMTSAQIGVEMGLASYYADSYQGRKTASGEKYDKNKYTAGHKELELGTIVKVTRIDNKKTVNVRINDRGPYIAGRIIDLSRVAAEKIGIIEDGHASVKIEVLERATAKDLADGGALTKPTAKPVAKTATKPVAKPKTTTKKAIPASYSDTKKVDKQVEPAKKAAAPVAKKVTLTPKGAEKAELQLQATEDMSKLTLKDFKEYDLYKIQIKVPEHKGFGVQVASLSSYDNVIKTIAELQGKWFDNVLISVEKGADEKPIYKAILGPFKDRVTADAYKSQLKKKKKMEGFVVDLSGLK